MKQSAGNIGAIIIACAIIKLLPKTVLTVIGAIVLLIIIICVIAFLGDSLRTKRIKRFMKQNNGKYFLSYSSNKKLKQTIETDLKPLFDFDYTVIYNNRNKIESNLDEETINHLQNHSVELKLPILYKVTKEKILVNSFYEEVNEIKEKYINKEVFEKRINNKLKKQS